MARLIVWVISINSTNIFTISTYLNFLRIKFKKIYSKKIKFDFWFLFIALGRPLDFLRIKLINIIFDYVILIETSNH